MGRKNKNGSQPQQRNVPNRDLVQRMNFLYQSSVYLDALSNAAVSSSERRSFSDLARNQITILRSIGSKSQIRMDPDVKRSICIACDSILIPGSTCITRIKRSHVHRNRRITSCLKCRHSRSIPSPPEPREDDLDTTCDAIQDPNSTQKPVATDGSTDRALEKCRQRLERRQRPPPRLSLFSERNIGHIHIRGGEVIS